MLTRLILLVVLLTVLIATLLILRRPPGDPVNAWEVITVRRGLVVESGHESGTLAPRTPVLVTAPFEARLSWLVEDATWVEAGAPLAILADDEELRRLADERSQLEDARQEVAINRLRRAQEVDEQAAKVALASRSAALERGRHRVATEPAVGGEELVRLAELLAPSEDNIRSLRTTAQTAQAAWQESQDLHLDALGRWQEAQDNVLRLESRLADLAPASTSVTTTGGVADTGQAARDRRRRDRAATESASVTAEDTVALHQRTAAELSTARAQVIDLGHTVEKARVEAEGRRPARDQAAAALQAAEDATLDLRLRLEIERRALPATTLTLDRDNARLDLVEADRRLREGQAAFAARALSKAALDDLESAQADATARLAILEQRLAVVAAPPAPEVVAEASARLAKAEADEAAARAEQERALAILDQTIAVADAKVRRSEALIAQRSRRFPATIQGELDARERELTQPGSDRPALEAAIAQLRQDLAQAKATPPNIVTAPVAGLARLRRDGGRTRQAGDQVWSADVVVEVHPPGNLEVLVRVNESTVSRYAAGMPVAIRIPALAAPPNGSGGPAQPLVRGGTIASVSGVGRDKSQSNEATPVFTGVTQFEVRIALTPEADGRDADLRQGMSAVVTIEMARHENALWLPRAAARHDAGRWLVRRQPGATPSPVDLLPAGDDALLVRSGLDEGATVVIERTAP